MQRPGLPSSPSRGRVLLALGGFAGAGLVAVAIVSSTAGPGDAAVAGVFDGRTPSVRAVGPGRGARIVRSSPSFGLR